MQLKQLPPGTMIAPGVVIGENGEPQRAAGRSAPARSSGRPAGGPGPRPRPVPLGLPWDSSAPPGKGGRTTPSWARGCGGAPTTVSTGDWTATTRSLKGVEDEQLYAELVEVANELAELPDRVRQVCVEAQRRSPSDGLDIPGALAGVHRSLSKAGNSLATTAEAAAMLRLAVGPDPGGGGVSAAPRGIGIGAGGRRGTPPRRGCYGLSRRTPRTAAKFPMGHRHGDGRDDRPARGGRRRPGSPLLRRPRVPSRRAQGGVCRPARPAGRRRHRARATRPSGCAARP